MDIRPANVNEAQILSELAFRSKAVWGYSDEFMNACRAELTITEDYIHSSETFVMDSSDRVVGFYALIRKASTIALDYLYVDPQYMGNGHGKQLWNHAVERSRELGYQRLTIDADPHAEPFYLGMGAERVGVVPSGSIPGRTLPLLAYKLAI